VYGSASRSSILGHPGCLRVSLLAHSGGKDRLRCSMNRRDQDPGMKLFGMLERSRNSAGRPAARIWDSKTASRCWSSAVALEGEPFSATRLQRARLKCGLFEDIDYRHPAACSVQL